MKDTIKVTKIDSEKQVNLENIIKEFELMKENINFLQTTEDRIQEELKEIREQKVSLQKNQFAMQKLIVSLMKENNEDKRMDIYNNYRNKYPSVQGAVASRQAIETAIQMCQDTLEGFFSTPKTVTNAQ